MDPKSLVCIFFVFLALPISISNLESPSSSAAARLKPVQRNPFQTRLLYGAGSVDRRAYNRKHPSLHTTEADQVQDEDRDWGIPSYVKKGGSHGKGGGANSAGHHTPAGRKNRSSSLSPPSWIIFSIFPCIMVFSFILLPL